MLTFQGYFKTGDGKLGIIILPAGTSPPAGTAVFGGIARRSDGYIYVVMA